MPHCHRIPLARASTLIPVLVALAAPLEAQRTPMVGGRSEVFAGSQLENYLRLLQLTGDVPLYPWSVRAFSPSEVDSLVPRTTTHPWAARYDLGPKTRGRLWVDVVQPRVTLIENTGFPYGQNDGPVWAGRGLTTVVQGGVALRYGPFSATIAPLVFRAENKAFALMANGQTGKLVYADGRLPTAIDRPQRFGDKPYTVLDPGQTTVRLESGALAVGISTANQAWGPGDGSPLILGNNAAGFPHVFVGTSRPVDVRFATVHGRLIYSDLRQSEYSYVTGPMSRRFGAGFVLAVSPRAIRGLELGFSRFFHRAWPSGGLGWREIAWPFQSLLKARLQGTDFDSLNPNEDPDNQLASVFARWVLPGSGFELYGEFAREDHAWDLRDVLVEPDHSGGYTLGFRKLLRMSSRRIVVVRGEVMNTEVSTLGRGRGQGTFYYHSYTPQGHTERGQILGAPDGYGGAAALVALDGITRGGRWSLSWSRSVRGTLRLSYVTTGAPDGRSPDVVHSVAVERVAFLGGYDISAGLVASVELNRDYRRDGFNLNGFVGVRAHLARARDASAPGN